MFQQACLLVLCTLAGSLAAPATDATIGDYPWMASIRTDGRHICGGSILNADWILTSGTCAQLANYYPNYVTVVVGSANLSAGGQEYGIQSVVAHPLFSANNWQYDVGLVRLAAPIALGDGVQPVALVAPGTATPAEGSGLNVFGWGRLIDGAPSVPDKLRYTFVGVVNREACAAAYGRQGYSNIDLSVFCAGASDDDSCQPAGGPALDTNNVQVGVASWGLSCFRPGAGLAGVYANLANPVLRDWIQATASV